jgi:hypothetical protein
VVDVVVLRARDVVVLRVVDVLVRSVICCALATALSKCPTLSGIVIVTDVVVLFVIDVLLL